MGGRSNFQDLVHGRKRALVPAGEEERRKGEGGRWGEGWGEVGGIGEGGGECGGIEGGREKREKRREGKGEKLGYNNR